MERYRELIDIVNDHRRGKEVAIEGNIYEIARSPRNESIEDLRVVVEHLFRDEALSGQDTGKRTLKLRLRRMPEVIDIPPPEKSRPAIAYLTNGRKTENRMAKLLQN
jgi:hypothetical protein